MPSTISHENLAESDFSSIALLLRGAPVLTHTQADQRKKQCKGLRLGS